MGHHFFGVNRLTSDLYAMEANSMLLITKKAAVMPQVDDSGEMPSWDPSWTFSPPLGNEMGLAPP